MSSAVKVLVGSASVGPLPFFLAAFDFMIGIMLDRSAGLVVPVFFVLMVFLHRSRFLAAHRDVRRVNATGKLPRLPRVSKVSRRGISRFSQVFSILLELFLCLIIRSPWRH